MASRRSKNNQAQNDSVNTAPATTTEERAQAAQGENTVTEQTNETPAAPAVADASVLRLKGTNKSGKTAAYTIPGQPGSVRVARAAIVGDFTPEFSALQFKAADAARAEKAAQKAARKESRAVSAAERAAKLEQRIAKANAAAEKNRAKLAKLQAKQPVSAQAQTEAAVAQAEAGGVTEVAQEAALTE